MPVDSNIRKSVDGKSEKNQVSQSNKWATLAHISENVNTKKTKFVANRGAKLQNRTNYISDVF